MPIDYPSVLDLKTEATPYSWSDREVMLYALGIGMGGTLSTKKNFGSSTRHSPPQRR